MPYALSKPRFGSIQPPLCPGLQLNITTQAAIVLPKSSGASQNGVCPNPASRVRSAVATILEQSFTGTATGLSRRRATTEWREAVAFYFNSDPAFDMEEDARESEAYLAAWRKNRKK